MQLIGVSHKHSIPKNKIAIVKTPLRLHATDRGLTQTLHSQKQNHNSENPAETSKRLICNHQCRLHPAVIRLDDLYDIISTYNIFIQHDACYCTAACMYYLFYKYNLPSCIH